MRDTRKEAQGADKLTRENGEPMRPLPIAWARGKIWTVLQSRLEVKVLVPFLDKSSMRVCLRLCLS